MSAFFIVPRFALSQDKTIEVLPGTEKLIYNKETGETRLIGHIHLKFQQNIVFCDSATYNEKKSKIKAYGNVHINRHDTLNLYCDSLNYDDLSKIAHLYNHVRIRDREYKITCDSLKYDMQNQTASYTTGGKIERIFTNERLTSKNGYFYPSKKNIVVSGNVFFKGENTKMKTDSLSYYYLKKRVVFNGPTNIVKKDSTDITCENGWYNTDSEEFFIHQKASLKKNNIQLIADTIQSNPLKKISNAFGNIHYTDYLKKYYFSGNRLYNNEITGKGFLTHKALFSYILNNDTIHIHADTLFTYLDSLNVIENIRAYHNALIYSNQMQGKSDSITFNKVSSCVQLYKSPILWSNKAELKGEFIQIFLKDSIIDHAEILQKATAIIEVDSGNYYNQVGGKKMLVYFDSINQLKKIDVEGNAQTIYYPEEEKKSDTIIEIQRKGMTRLYSSRIKIYLYQGEFTKVVYADQPDGVFYPLDKINVDEKYIVGYSWNPAQRPKSINDLISITETKNTLLKSEKAKSKTLKKKGSQKKLKR